MEELKISGVREEDAENIWTSEGRKQESEENCA
jgi:hypothetical protein